MSLTWGLMSFRWISLFSGRSLLLANERLVDVRNNTSSGDGGLDQAVQLFVSSDGELQMARCDTLHFQILGGIASQLQNLSGEVFQNGAGVDGSSSSNSAVASGVGLQMSVDSAHGELEPSPGRS